MGFWAHVPCRSSFLWTGCCLGKGLHLPVEPMFFFLVFVGLLTIDSAISLHRACYSFTSFFFISCYPMGLRADVPAVPAHFFINLLLKASLAYFPHLYLFWVLLANIPIMLAYFIFLGLPQPIYFLFTSFTLMGFLVDLLSFLNPITTSLHFITFWVIGL